ncbi:MAG: phosphatase PAP2 family protein [Pirellulales bacterium]
MTRGRVYLAALVLALAAAAALAVDLPVARACRTHPQSQKSVVPRDVKKVLTLGEVFAHGAGVVGIALTLWICNPARKRDVVRLLVASLGAGLAADLVKFLLVARTRPHASNLDLSPLDTFVAFVPLASSRFAETRFSRDFQSCPSAHAAVAAGLAVALSAMYPRGRWWFALLAAIAMAQRIDAGAHFVSDTLAGASLGCFVGALVALRPATLGPATPGPTAPQAPPPPATPSSESLGTPPHAAGE